MLSLELRVANITLDWELAPRVPAIAGDHVQLQQVFVNLIMNARDSLLETAADSRKITLRTWVGPDAVWVDVEDNGLGLSDDIAGQLFEPFVTSKKVGAGLGLGLTICDGIVAELGGTLRARNRPEGGAEFVIELRGQGRAERVDG